MISHTVGSCVRSLLTGFARIAIKELSASIVTTLKMNWRVLQGGLLESAREMVQASLAPTAPDTGPPWPLHFQCKEISNLPIFLHACISSPPELRRNESGATPPCRFLPSNPLAICLIFSSQEMDTPDAFNHLFEVRKSAMYFGLFSCHRSSASMLTICKALHCGVHVTF